MLKGHDLGIFEYSGHHLLECGPSDYAPLLMLLCTGGFGQIQQTFWHFVHFCRLRQTINLQSLSDLGRLLNAISQHILTLSSAVFW